MTHESAILPLVRESLVRESVIAPTLHGNPRPYPGGIAGVRGLLLRNHHGSRSGFTLLEMLLAISILVLLISAMFGFYWSTLRMRDRGTRAVEGTQLARVVAYRIANEIRGAGGVLTTLGPGIAGTEHEIRLNTVVLPDQDILRYRTITDKQLPAQSDVREIRYYLGYDPDNEQEYPDGTSGGCNLGLVRREVKTLRQASMLGDHRDEVDTDLYAIEIKYLRFRYFDGVDWLRKWELSGLPGQNTLPQAVEITVGYDPPVPPEDPNALDFEEQDESEIADPEPFSVKKFSMVVRVPQADTFFGSRLIRAQSKMTSGGLDSGGISGKFGSGGLGSGGGLGESRGK